MTRTTERPRGYGRAGRTEYGEGLIYSAVRGHPLAGGRDGLTPSYALCRSVHRAVLRTAARAEEGIFAGPMWTLSVT